MFYVYYFVIFLLVKRRNSTYLSVFLPEKEPQSQSPARKRKGCNGTLRRGCVQGLSAEPDRGDRPHPSPLLRWKRGALSSLLPEVKTQIKNPPRKRARSQIGTFPCHLASCFLEQKIKRFAKGVVFPFRPCVPRVSSNTSVRCLRKTIRCLHLCWSLEYQHLSKFFHFSLVISSFYPWPLSYLSHPHLTSWRFSFLSVLESWDSDTFTWSTQCSTHREICGPEGLKSQCWYPTIKGDRVQCFNLGGGFIVLFFIFMCLSLMSLSPNEEERAVISLSPSHKNVNSM